MFVIRQESHPLGQQLPTLGLVLQQDSLFDTEIPICHIHQGFFCFQIYISLQNIRNHIKYSQLIHCLWKSGLSNIYAFSLVTISLCPVTLVVALTLVTIVIVFMKTIAITILFIQFNLFPRNPLGFLFTDEEQSHPVGQQLPEMGPLSLLAAVLCLTGKNPHQSHPVRFVFVAGEYLSLEYQDLLLVYPVIHYMLQS